jgi:hypothetical protein
MIDTEVTVINALESDPVLSGLVGNKIFRYFVPEEFADQYPYIRVVEINNIDSNYTDNKAIASEVDIQIDFWTTDDPNQLQAEIDRIMKSLEWKRISVTPFYEDNTGAIRKSLRYQTKIRLGE